jgi:hypothetical protein
MGLIDPIFHDEAKATTHIEALGWNGEPVCPHRRSLAVRKMGGKTQADRSTRKAKSLKAS